MLHEKRSLTTQMEEENELNADYSKYDDFHSPYGREYLQQQLSKDKSPNKITNTNSKKVRLSPILNKKVNQRLRDIERNSSLNIDRQGRNMSNRMNTLGSVDNI